MSDQKYTILSVLRDFLFNASPFVLTRVGVELGSDYYAMVMLASLDQPGQHNYLAATSLIEAFQGMVRSTSASALYYSAFMVGQASSAKNVGKIWRTAHLFALSMTPSALLLMAFSGDILKGFSQDKNSSEITQNYFYGYMSGFLFTLLVAANQQFLLGLKKTIGASMPWVVFFSSLLQRGFYIGMSHWFIFGKPRFGEKGLGFASSLSAFLAYILLIGYLFSSKDFSEFHLLASDFSRKWREMVIKGIEIGISSGVELLHILVSNIMLGYLSQKALAAAQPTWRYLHFLIGLAFSCSQIAAISMDKSNGEHSAHNNKLYAYCNMGINFSLSALVLLFYLFFKEAFIRPFIDTVDEANKEVVNMSKNFLEIGLFTQLADSIRISSGRALQGLGHTRVPLLVNGSLMALNMIAIVALTIGLEWSPSNILIARAVPVVLGAGILLLGLAQELGGNKNGIVSKLNTWAACFSCHQREKEGGAYLLERGSHSPG